MKLSTKSPKCESRYIAQNVTDFRLGARKTTEMFIFTVKSMEGLQILTKRVFGNWI